MRKTDDETILKMLEDGHTQKAIAEYFNVSPAAICKRAKRLEAYPQRIKELNSQEQRFVMSIAEGKSQTAAAIDAYECSTVASAKSLGSQLMKKPKIGAALSEWMDYHGLTKSYRVQKLCKHVDNRDPNVSLKALDQTFKIDGSYRETHVHIGMTREDYDELVEDQSVRQESLETSKQELQAIEDRIRELRLQEREK